MGASIGICRFPKIEASFFGGGSVRRSIISGDLNPGSPYFGNLQ